MGSSWEVGPTEPAGALVWGNTKKGVKADFWCETLHDSNAEWRRMREKLAGGERIRRSGWVSLSVECLRGIPMKTINRTIGYMRPVVHSNVDGESLLEILHRPKNEKAFVDGESEGNEIKFQVKD